MTVNSFTGRATGDRRGVRISQYTKADYLYTLPDGKTIRVAADLCKGASYVSYTLANGRITYAVIAPGQ